MVLLERSLYLHYAWLVRRGSAHLADWNAGTLDQGLDSGNLYAGACVNGDYGSGRSFTDHGL